MHGSPRPAAPDPQTAPKKGTGPRLDAGKAARKLERLPHLMLSWRESDPYPVVVPVRVEDADAGGIRLAGPRGRCPRAGAARACSPTPTRPTSPA